MKKIFYYIPVFTLSSFLLLGTFSSCKSTKQNSDSALEISEAEGSDSESELSKSELKKLKKEQKKAEKAAKKNQKKTAKELKKAEENDSQKTEEAIFPKEFVKDVGIVRLRYKRALGTFGLSVLNSENQAFPVLSTANEFTKTSFFLKSGSKQYKLIASKQILSNVSNSSNGMTVVYTFKDVATVTLRFEVIAQKETVDADILKITATVKNDGTRNEDFALKSVFDTILGESAKYHFYNADGTPVKSELLIRDVKTNPAVVSKNNAAAMQFIFDGADITPIESVALANFSTLEKSSWEPEMLTYRSFDTLMSYNNSAVAIIWPEKRLSPKKEFSEVFYVSFASDGNEPAGYSFIKGISEKAEEKSESEPAAEFSDDKIDESDVAEAEKIDEQNLNLNEEKTEEELPSKPAEEEIPPVINPVTPVQVVEKDSPVEKSSDYTKPTVKFDINNLSKEQLTPEYIQNLIDRINALEENSSSVNRNELLQLNAELDAILQTLRQ